MEPGFKRLRKDGDNIGAIGGWDELKRALDLLKELIATIDGLLLEVDFVSDANAGNVRALIAHFSVPVSQIRVGHLSRDIEDHDANVGAEVIRWVKLVEWLLSRSVPNVCQE